MLDREQRIEEKKNEENLNNVKAEPQNSIPVSEDILTSSSALWDNSPKLLQILNEIDFSVLQDVMEESDLGEVSKEVFPSILKKYQSKDDTFFAKLFASLNAEKLQELFNRSNHWLNKAEIRFIIDSWNRKESRFAQLKKERDDALRMVRANNNVIQAIQIDKTNPTLALRVAEANYLLYPESVAAAGIFNELLSNSAKVKVLKTIQNGHVNPISSVAFSPIGTLIATASHDHTIKLWNLQGELSDSVIRTHSLEVTSIAFSPAGDKLVSGGMDGAKLWNLEDNQAINLTGSISVSAVAFSKDGTIIATGSYDKTIKLWDLQGKPINSFSGGHSDGVTAVAFSPTDNQRLISGAMNGTIKLWNLAGNSFIEIERHRKRINSVTFSPDGNNVLIGSEDGTAAIRDLNGQLLLKINQSSVQSTPLKTFGGHNFEITAVAFAPNGQHILTGSKDGTARLWNKEGQLIKSLLGHKHYVNSVAFSPDGHQIITGSNDNTCKIWDLRQQITKTFNEPTKGFIKNEEILSIAYSPDGKKILTGSKDATLKLWDIEKDTFESFTGHNKGVNAIAFSPDGKKILSGSEDKTIRLWNIATKEFTSVDLKSPVYTVAFSPTSPNILTGSGSSDAKIRLFAFDETTLAINENTITIFDEHKAKINSVVFSSDGEIILSGSNDNSIIIRNIDKTEVIHKQESTDVTALAYSPKGIKEILAIGLNDGTVKLWFLEADKEIIFKEDSRYIKSIAFSPDGQHILTGSLDQEAKLWDLGGKLITQFIGHESRINDVAFDPDGQTILTCSLDETAKLWLTPWAYLEKRVEGYSMETLKEEGLEFAAADVPKKKEWNN